MFRLFSVQIRTMPRGAVLAAALSAGTVLAGAAPAERVPVTERPINDAPGVFRFAILSDRTGGMRPGVFEDAVRKVQRLQPEFVLSVGDLIDGYTTDPAVWEAQWTEFEGIVAALEMPFYYVPGNHDISNPQLLQVWRERRGAPYFSFKHKDVLFLALHTEDRPGGGLGAAQVAWAQQTLAAHADARWTLVFFHRPLWRLGGDQAGYAPVAAALAGRPYTVFSAHEHHYLKAERGGRAHYVLATSGGGTPGRGAEFGEFDHVTWVTMKPDGPAVAHLQLDGIIADDVVHEGIFDRIQALRLGTWLEVMPVKHSAPEVTRLTVPVRLNNPTTSPLQVTGELLPPPDAGMTFTPASIEHTVPPGESMTLAVELRSATPRSLHTLNEAGLSLTLTGTYVIDGTRRALPTRQALRFDAPLRVPSAGAPVTIDGVLDEWPGAAFTTVRRPIRIDEDWDWSGPEDGSFRFAVQRRDRTLLVAVEMFDDRVLTAPRATERQDRLRLELGSADRTRRFEFLPTSAAPDGAARITPQGWIVECTLPLDATADDATEVRFNLGWIDHDRPANTKPSVLWWRDGAIPGFGTLLLDADP